MQLPRYRRPGYILSKDGRFVVFDESSFRGLDVEELFLGDWVEYDEMGRNEGTQAFGITPMIQRAGINKGKFLPTPAGTHAGISVSHRHEAEAYWQQRASHSNIFCSPIGQFDKSAFNFLDCFLG